MRSVCLSLIAILSVLIVPSAQASVITAQNNGVDNSASVVGFGNQFGCGQSFTATVSGPLDSILLQIVVDSPVDALDVSVWHGGGDLPGVLDGTISSNSVVTGMNTFDFSSLNIPISAGTKYVITATTVSLQANPQYEMRGIAFNPYSDGLGIVKTGSAWQTGPFGIDFIFTANVSVPEPASVAMALGGVAILVRRRR